MVRLLVSDPCLSLPEACVLLGRDLPPDGDGDGDDELTTPGRTATPAAGRAFVSGLRVVPGGGDER